MSKKEKIDLHEVSSDSENFIRSNVFFLDLMLPIIRKYTPPITVDDSIALIQDCIQEYYGQLNAKLHLEPFSTIYEKMAAYLTKDGKVQRVKGDGKPDVFGFTSFISKINIDKEIDNYDHNEFVSVFMSVYRRCLEFYKDDKPTIALFKTNYISFLTIVHQVINIASYQDKMTNDFQSSLECIIALAFTEGLKVNDLYNENKVQDYMASMKGKENAGKINPELQAHYDRAIKEADKRWKDGSKLTHGKMAKELCEEFNPDIEKKTTEGIQKLYPNRGNDPDKIGLYNYDIEFVLPHHLMSSHKLTKLLEKTARKHGKYLNRHEKGKKLE